MQPLPLEFLVPVGALEVVAGVLPFAVLVVVLANLLTRVLAQRTYVRQADEGEDDEAVSRYLPHEATNVLLVALAFAMTIVQPHGGLVLATLVVGLFVSDFFEFEARRVEARNGMEIEKPKSAIFASALVLAYAAFQALFFLVEPYWGQVV
ncbi:DUF7313 family protein [Halorarum salinum]|uniref:DUF7313 domain-containing protein n=1 Tax=Halorarum salinum TaxID=2743089 RepID=A0A7D5QIQ8_9EURY|nr:hypothetical protein [Halobaculum salinum]QLG63582.1 hypothetical protein HUG12_18360 [Halobaculum salinum]